MHRFLRRALFAAVAAAAACDTPTLLGPDRVVTPLLNGASLPSVRIAEIHYDNTGTDAGEAIEVSGPAGTDLTGWNVVLYNGNGGVTYDTDALTGTIPATCGARGVVVLTYPSNGIQNGSPDGVALVDNTGTVVEYLSYEGTFAATNGPALGTPSTDIGVAELGTEPLGQSLQRNGLGAWSGPQAATFGACNDNVAPPPPPVASVTVSPSTVNLLVGATQQLTATALDAGGQPVAGAPIAWSSADVAVATVSGTGLVTAVGGGTVQVTATSGVASGSTAVTVTAAPPPPPPATVRFSELHYDNTGADVGEAIEIEGPAGTDLTGWSVVLYNGNGGAPYETIALSGTIPATCTPKGVVVLTTFATGIQNGAPDGLALVGPSGVVEFLSYEGAFTAVGGAASGMLSTDIGVSELGTEPIGRSLQRDNSGTWLAPAAATFGACFGSAPPPPSNTISFSGRTASDPALPVGFQDQLFATVRDPGGTVLALGVTWSSENANASVDADGVVTALVAGTAVIRATATDGTTGTVSLPTRVATASATAAYAGNAEFGEPADGNAADDLLVRRAQYVTSWNPLRGTPNWVSYNLEATHFGAEDRCDCFTFDPALPAGTTPYTTAAYTGAGAFHGYGIDRGHLARSFDRTAGSLDNAHTFYFTNIVPQAADQNQGPWAAMEGYLGDLARLQGKEVYIIAGVAGNKGTLKDQGRIVIPTHTWKVAVVMDRDEGLANVTSWADAQVIAAIMPNEPGVRNVDWNTYRTTVDAVEALSGYDLLALLPDQAEIALESNTRPPNAAHDGPWAGSEGGAILMSGAASTDPDNDVLTFAWDFGDGTTATGLSPVHTYAQDGSYTVTLTVTDTRGLFSTATATATVGNVAPVILDFTGATLLPGETYTRNGSFTDPGADPWSASVDYGTGAGSTPLSLTGKAFALSHTYGTAGTFSVTVRVSDDDATSTMVRQVVVLSQAQGAVVAGDLVVALRDAGKLQAGLANALSVRLRSVQRLLLDDQAGPAASQLANIRAEVDQLIQVGFLSAADAAELIAWLDRLAASIP